MFLLQPFAKDLSLNLFNNVSNRTSFIFFEGITSAVAIISPDTASAANKDLSLQFTLEKLRNIAQTSANCIGEFCPFCHLQFDLGQREVKEIFGEEYSYPVLHVAQMLGLTIGMTLEEVGATKHFTPINPDDLGL